MQKRKIMLLATVFVIALGAGGCKKDGAVYHTGVCVQTESYRPEPSEHCWTEEEDETYSLPPKKQVVSEKEKLSSAEANLSDAKEVDSADIQEESAGYVHVCGAVNVPGVYPFREGMRLFEAVELAGGFSTDADEVWLNQAQILQDGQRLYIYTREETKELQNVQPQDRAQPFGAPDVQAVQGGSPYGNAVQEQLAGEPLAEGKVNINTADKAELMTLPGIGEARAEAIIQYRSQCGGFSAVEEIQEISGIKNAVYSKIKDRITV